jgi:hypothetical protein
MKLEEYIKLGKIANDIPENKIITVTIVENAQKSLQEMVNYALSLGLSSVKSSELKAVHILCKGVKDNFSVFELNKILICILNNPYFFNTRVENVIKIFKALSGITLNYQI